MKILFQGDSITDCGRSRNNGSVISIGQGYALIVSARLGAENPGKYQFFNFGVSGNRVVDVYSRIKADCWNHQPDVLSILIGVNDVWHEINANNGVDAGRFRNIYRMMIEDTLERLPGIRLIMLEPFALQGTATADNWEVFRSEVEKRAGIVSELAAQFSQTFVPLQKMFDEACDVCPADYWISDGVHPTPAGHQLIAQRWLEAFRSMDLK